MLRIFYDDGDLLLVEITLEGMSAGYCVRGACKLSTHWKDGRPSSLMKSARRFMAVGAVRSPGAWDKL